MVSLNGLMIMILTYENISKQNMLVKYSNCVFIPSKLYFDYYYYHQLVGMDGERVE